jgi:hypothetical protein
MLTLLLRRSHPLPGGELRTLRDAGHFIAKLPRLHDAPAWRSAI